jgi:HPt (histidine-containing phosphotransfer) domain-containing protein
MDPGAAEAADFHFLRGGASNLGFEAMVDACQAAEVACNAGETPDIAAVATAFRGSVAAIAPEIPGLDTAA